jgi:hypothetical protein
VKRVSKKNGEISSAICQNIGQSKLKSFCVCVKETGVGEELGGVKERREALKLCTILGTAFLFSHLLT